jgi:hypothetical protein
MKPPLTIINWATGRSTEAEAECRADPILGRTTRFEVSDRGRIHRDVIEAYRKTV